MKRKKTSFEELVNSNKKEILLDYKLLEIIEDRIENRRLQNESSSL
jgi:hypothetical protein